jgi:uncharacterized membrane-anchored protein
MLRTRRTRVRRVIIAVTALLVLLVANIGIYRNEQVLASGRSVLLELAPVDPRSLMQGDYMALRFRASDAVHEHATAEWQDGRAVIGVDPNGVGTFRRIDDGTPLAADELVISFRVRDDAVKFATNAFFFQEADADHYANARFGEFRVSQDGTALLIALRGEKLEVLGPPVDLD